MPHILIGGAGVFGTWTAWHLRAAGARVTLVEAYAPGHSRASSGGESRIIRCGYGPDEVYSRFALRSPRLWREFSASVGPEQAPLLYRCGVLWLAARPDPYIGSDQAHLGDGGGIPSRCWSRLRFASAIRICAQMMSPWRCSSRSAAS